MDDYIEDCECKALVELGQSREAFLEMTPYELSVLYYAYIKKEKARYNLSRDMVLNAVSYCFSGSKNIEPFIPTEGEKEDKVGKINTVATQKDLLEFEKKLKENEDLESKIRIERDSIFNF